MSLNVRERRFAIFVRERRDKWRESLRRLVTRGVVRRYFRGFCRRLRLLDRLLLCVDCVRVRSG
jgi:hypothetical protein